MSNPQITGRAAFEQWEALGEDGEAPFWLAHGAALLVAHAEECASGHWEPGQVERSNARLLLRAIADAVTLIWTHCPLEEGPMPPQSAAIARRGNRS